MRQWSARILRGGLLAGVALLACLSPRPPEARAQSTPLRLVRSTPGAIVLEFTLPDYTLEPVYVQGEPFTRITADGLAAGGEPGAPQLPRLGALIGLPPAGGVSLRVLEVEEAQVSLSHPVYPEPVPVVATGRGGEGIERLAQPLAGQTYEFAPDPVVYAQDALYPDRFVDLGEPGWVRDRRVARVTLTPVRYNPVRGELVLARRLVVEVAFEGGARDATMGALDAPSPAFESLLSRALLNFESARNWRASRDPAASAAAPVWASSPATQPGSYKVVVDRDGLYRLTYAELRAAGVPVDDVDPRTWQVYEQDQEVSIEVSGEQDGSFDPGDVVLFYGQNPHSRYVDRNVYWIRFGDGNGRRMSSRSFVSASAPFSPTWTTASYDESRYYDPLFPGGDGDHWYAADLRPDTVKTLSMPLMSPSPDAPTATLRVRLLGYTQSSTANPDHHVTVQVNGRAAGDLRWDGKGAVTKSVVLDAALLRAGTNSVTLATAGDTGAPVEGAWLDAVELDYALRAVVGDEAHVSIQPGIQSYVLGGFGSADLRVYDVTEPRHPIRLTGGAVTGSGSYTLAFADMTLRSANYYVVAGTRIHPPVTVVADRPSDLHSAANGADYVIITHGDYGGAIQPLVARRRAQGLRVTVVDVQDVYDEFGGGLLGPEAIRSFIGYAYDHWTAPALTYVLLVGDGHYDYLDHYGYGAANPLPPYLGMVDPWWGETAADNRYAAVSGEDILPDVMLGRLPVASAAEAAAVVHKIVSYEQSPRPGEWNAYHVFAADNADHSARFTGPLDAVYATYVTQPWLGQRIYLDDLPSQTARRETLAAWQRGALLMTFMGHSSWHQWAEEALLDIHDVPVLRNDHQWPVVLSMTCFTGFFHHPEYGTLDESLLRLDGGGAVATWSPSGLGLQTGHDHLYQGFYRSVFRDSETQLGPAIMAAKLGLYANTYGYDDLLDTYHLFGDPAMALNLTIRPWPHSIYLPVLYRDSMGG
jgi:hypothetical protein